MIFSQILLKILKFRRTSVRMTSTIDFPAIRPTNHNLDRNHSSINTSRYFSQLNSSFYFLPVV